MYLRKIFFYVMPVVVDSTNCVVSLTNTYYSLGENDV